MPRRSPVFVLLGVCFGSIAIGIIVYFIVDAINYSKTRDLNQGVTLIETNRRKFLSGLQNHDYLNLAILITPQAQQDLTEAKIRSMEESVEQKLGPLQQISMQPIGIEKDVESGVNGQMKCMDFTFRSKLTYEKGTATATLVFKSRDILNPTGLISDFKLSPDKQ